MTVVLAGGIVLPPQSRLATSLRRACKISNPAAGKHERLVARGTVSRWAPAPPATIAAWSVIPAEHQWAGGTVAPRHAPGAPPPTHDLRSDGAGHSFVAEPGFALRPYQAAALDQWLLDDDGVIVAPCGSGKTCIGLAAAALVGRRTLVLVHTLDLARQWVERAAAQLGTVAGLVGDGARDDGEGIVVATMQTLVKWTWADLYRWGKGFGLLIVDEAHKTPCDTLTSLLHVLPARWRLGLTATPEREDGLTPLMYWSLGPVVARIDHATLAAAGAILLPEIRTVRTGWKPEAEDATWTSQVGAICADADRNALILDHVLALVRDGLQVLVLSERVGHCEALAAACIAAGVPAAALVGKLSSKRRAAMLTAADDGALRVVTATTLADEGLDLPRLGAVVLATPCKALGRIEQRIGRVMRPAPGKPRPVVVDITDAWGPLLHQARLRRQVYTHLGAEMR